MFRELDQKAGRPEPVNLAARAYVQAAIDLVNWQEGDGPGRANDLYGRLCTATAAGGDLFQMLGRGTVARGADGQPLVVRTDGQPAGSDAHTIMDLRARLRDRLEQVRTYTGKKRAALRAIADAAVEAVTIRTVTKLELDHDARAHFIRQDFFTPGAGDGAEGLVIAVLLNPDQSVGELRVCPFCGRYFLSVASSDGGPKPAYCPGTDHQKQADRIKARARAKRWRNDNPSKPAKAAKHK
jgi:hypothetical protein